MKVEEAARLLLRTSLDFCFCFLFVTIIVIVFYRAIVEPIKESGIKCLFDKRERAHTIFNWAAFAVVALLFGLGIWWLGQDFWYVALAMSR